MGLFSIFLYTFTINCFTTENKKKLSICFALFIANNFLKSISSRKMCGFIGSLFKKMIPYNTTPTFREVGGVTQPRTFCRRHKTSHGITLTITKLIDFYSQGIITFLFAAVFNSNEPERQFIGKLILPTGTFKKLSSLCSGLQNFFWFQYKQCKLCLTKIPTVDFFKLLSAIYFQNMRIVTRDF